jgi:hypothetical protein
MVTLTSQVFLVQVPALAQGLQEIESADEVGLEITCFLKSLSKRGG